MKVIILSTVTSFIGFGGAIYFYKKFKTINTNFENKVREKVDYEINQKQAILTSEIQNLEESLYHLKLTKMEEDQKIERIIETRKTIEETELENLKSIIKEKSQEIEKIESEHSLKVSTLEEEMETIIKTLKELKNKRDKTLEVLVASAEEQDKENFKRITLSANDREDVKVLLKVEKTIHNKDILRKLIYKTYIENEMNEMFNRNMIDTQPGIYKIEEISTGKVYIGQSTNVKNRLREHVKASLGISSIAHQAIHEAMAENGLENYSFEILQNCERAELNKLEKYWIDFYSSTKWGYNKTLGGS